MKKAILAISVLGLLSGCLDGTATQERADQKNAQSQQKVYAIGQPVPKFDWSLTRDLLIQLQKIQNQNIVTHSVWRSSTGLIEGDCASIGYGIPFDTSLTNPLQNGGNKHYPVALEQAEPNGVFLSKNTSATWVLCVGEFGNIEPVYVEASVNAYPYPLNVDYSTNRVTRAGKATVVINMTK